MKETNEKKKWNIIDSIFLIIAVAAFFMLFNIGPGNPLHKYVPIILTVVLIIFGIYVVWSLIKHPQTKTDFWGRVFMAVVWTIFILKQHMDRNTFFADGFDKILLVFWWITAIVSYISYKRTKE